MSAYRDVIPIDECARCGYDEIKSSLHVHHIDRDRDNNNPSNLVLLCANCHMGLHHSAWELSEIGIMVPDKSIYVNQICHMSTTGFATITSASQERKMMDSMNIRLR